MRSLGLVPGNKSARPRARSHAQQATAPTWSASADMAATPSPLCSRDQPWQGTHPLSVWLPASALRCPVSPQPACPAHCPEPTLCMRLQPPVPALRDSCRRAAPGSAHTRAGPHLHKLHRLQRHLPKRVGVAAKEDVPEVVHLAGAGDDIGQLGVVDKPAARGGGGRSGTMGPGEQPP